MKTLSLSLLAIAAFASVPRGYGAEVSVQLPAETAVLKPAPGVEVAQANCMICHSVDYLQMQPPMARKFWEAEVKKMQQKYGAPIPDDKIVILVDYLTAAYGARVAAK